MARPGQARLTRACEGVLVLMWGSIVNYLTIIVGPHHTTPPPSSPSQLFYPIVLILRMSSVRSDWETEQSSTRNYSRAGSRLTNITGDTQTGIQSHSHTVTSPKNPNWASAITIESQNEIAEIEIENIVSMCLNAHWDNKIHVRGTCVGGMCSIAVTTLAWSWRDGAGNRFSNSHTESFRLCWTVLFNLTDNDGRESNHNER